MSGIATAPWRMSNGARQLNGGTLALVRAGEFGEVVRTVPVDIAGRIPAEGRHTVGAAAADAERLA